MISRRSDIAEAIARVIIEADGKTFVPTTCGEYIDRAIRLGLVPRNIKWDDPLTWEDAAIVLARLLDAMKKGVNL